MTISDTDRLNALKCFLTVNADKDAKNIGTLMIRHYRAHGQTVYFEYKEHCTVDEALDFLVVDMKEHPEYYKDVLKHK